MIKFIRRSCEDRSTVYVCLPGWRLIFREGKYAGWYRPRCEMEGKRMIAFFERPVRRKILWKHIEKQGERIERYQETVWGLCSENRQAKELLEKMAALFSPAERDLLMHPKENVIYAPGYTPRAYFTRESLVDEWGFTEWEAEYFFELVQEMAERREEEA